MPSPVKSVPVRPLIHRKNEELRRLVDSLVRNPVQLRDVYFELQFRQRKAARELREYVRGVLVKIDKPFPWPSTTVTASSGRLDDMVFELDQGVLKMLGYTTGLQGLGDAKRRDLLEDLYLETQPLLRGHPQEGQWGNPGSAKRLQKLANTIAAHARNAKRKRKPPLAAISDWEDDLAYLKRAHYDDQFTFQWPSTEA